MRTTTLRISPTRDLRYRLAYLGARPRIGKRVEFTSPALIRIGNDVTVNTNCVLSGEGGIIIGDQVLIGPGCMFFSFEHVFEDVDVPIRNQGYRLAPITIGDDVWIGAGCVVLGGVKVGRGAVIGAGTVLHRDVPDGGVVVGASQRLVKCREGYPPLPSAGPHGSDVGA